MEGRILHPDSSLSMLQRASAMSLSRRQFVQSSAAAIAAASASPLFAADKKKPEIPIVDCHQHLWDLSKFKLPWIMPGTLMAKNYVEEDYLKQAAGAERGEGGLHGGGRSCRPEDQGGQLCH